MGLSPLRLVVALVFGGMVTGGLYLTQQANGRPLPVAAAPVEPQRPLAATANPSALSLPAPPKRIVFRQTAPGDVVLTVQGEELVVQFVPAPAKAAPLASGTPASKRPLKVAAHPPLKTTPVATP